jgi:uncharacterized protein (UPF0212 family)
MIGCVHTKSKKMSQILKVDISTTTTKMAKPLLNFVSNDVGNTKKQQQH